MIKLERPCDDTNPNWLEHSRIYEIFQEGNHQFALVIKMGGSFSSQKKRKKKEEAEIERHIPLKGKGTT
jgi:hypothetical protein